MVTISCKSDNSSGIDYDLAGSWGIYEAYRDGVLTTTLEDGFFEFQDTMMTTNIMGSPISGSYNMEKNQFSHDSALPVKYEISEYSVTGDTMHLETEIRGFDFLFKVERIKDTIQ